ncbi:MAG: hypothetical protein KDA44_07465 [Planctomycetales bacterium]|nr:hypothetical protein [Planctomycetales bacterium]
MPVSAVPATKSSSPLVIGLGEALFDRFGDYAVLGGAPINFAVHAGQLLAERGGQGAAVSRVGDDELGRCLQAELQARRINLSGMQIDESAPTGVVEVTVDADGQPAYDIRTGAAWDRLEFDAALADLAARCDAVCFGTLAQRAPTSRAAIHAFLAAAPQALRMCDLNLRPPHYDDAVIEASLQAANAAKVNEEELELVANLVGGAIAAGSGDDQVFALMEHFHLTAAVVTRGARGTAVYRGGECFSAEPPPLARNPDADAVGAGDACAAAAACGLLFDWPLERIVTLANAAGGFVASQRGATPQLPANLIAKVAEPR